MSVPAAHPLASAQAAVPRRRASEDALLLALIAVVACAALLTPFVFRAADDNRLTSWHWVFAGAPLAAFAALLVCGIAAAFALRKIALPPRGADIWLFGLSFAAGAPFWSEPELIVDAARYFMQAKFLALYGASAFAAAWGRELSAWTDLPLIPFLYGLIFRYAGEERIYVQIFTTLLFSGTVVLTYRIGRELWDETLGFYGAALLLAMPYLLTQVPLMLVDVPAMFFIALAVFTTIKALQRGSAGWIAASTTAITLSALSKYSAWPMLTVLIPVYLTQRGAAPRAALLRAAIIAGLALAALYCLWLLPKHDVVMAQLRLLWDYQRPGLGRWQESFVSTFAFQIHPFIVAAAAYSLYAAIRRRDVKYAILGWLLALALLGGIGRIRYLLALFPLLALAAAYGWREIRNSEARAFALLCAVIPSLTIALLAYLPFLQTASAANLQRAGAHLDSLDVSRVEVITLEQTRAAINPAVSVPLLDLATRKPLIYQPPATAPKPPRDVGISALRFTWDFAQAGYTLEDPAGRARRTALAVIFADPAQPLPAHVTQQLEQYCLTGEFLGSERVFGYQTLVRIYQPARGHEPRCPRGEDE